MSNAAISPTPPPPACVEAREAFALELAGGPAPSAPVRAHVAACRDCAGAVARIEKIWAVPPAAFAAALPKPASSMDRMLAGALERAKQEPSAAAPVISLDSHREQRRQSSLVPAAVGFALAASLAAIAFVGPQLFGPTGTEVAVVTPVPAPTPAGPPGVRLKEAKGDVSFVPIDGSVIAALKLNDAIPPGLFAATGGAALEIEGAGTLAVRGDSTVLIGGTEKAPVVTIARGEIFVDLPKGSIRSFFVHTPTGAVRVTGTQFGVKIGPAGTNVEVTRGSVVVSGPEGETTVQAGEAANLKAGEIPALVAPADPNGDPLGWVRVVAPEIAPPKPVAALSVQRTRTVPAAGGGTQQEVQEVSGLDKDAIANGMDKRYASLRRCYEVALAREPALQIRAEVSFRVDEDGRPENVRVAGLPEAHMKMGLCLMDATKAAVFPGAAPGTEVKVRYPLKFNPQP